ncbi:hypothetical protein NQ317_019376 [Molorchus minor]|uniref:Uncharacterized protein n=1 Tax=Molorchus minor TaxID=1323400 RepID=A0ABQ9IX71_9CUCU|nr:hypothetical protein NQ317_019376 [Molorchus minor]
MSHPRWDVDNTLLHLPIIFSAYSMDMNDRDRASDVKNSVWTARFRYRFRDFLNDFMKTYNDFGSETPIAQSNTTLGELQRRIICWCQKLSI